MPDQVADAKEHPPAALTDSSKATYRQALTT